MIAQSTRIELPAQPAEHGEPGWDAGVLYLLVDAPQPANMRFGPTRLKPGHPVGLVHVMSRPARGEIRGYWIVDGALELQPALLRWRLVDDAVKRALGLPLREVVL